MVHSKHHHKIRYNDCILNTVFIGELPLIWKHSNTPLSSVLTSIQVISLKNDVDALLLEMECCLYHDYR